MKFDSVAWFALSAAATLELGSAFTTSSRHQHAPLVRVQRQRLAATEGDAEAKIVSDSIGRPDLDESVDKVLAETEEVLKAAEDAIKGASQADASANATKVESEGGEAKTEAEVDADAEASDADAESEGDAEASEDAPADAPKEAPAPAPAPVDDGVPSPMLAFLSKARKDIDESLERTVQKVYDMTEQPEEPEPLAPAPAPAPVAKVEEPVKVPAPVKAIAKEEEPAAAPVASTREDPPNEFAGLADKFAGIFGRSAKSAPAEPEKPIEKAPAPLKASPPTTPPAEPETPTPSAPSFLSFLNPKSEEKEPEPEPEPEPTPAPPVSRSTFTIPQFNLGGKKAAKEPEPEPEPVEEDKPAFSFGLPTFGFSPKEDASASDEAPQADAKQSRLEELKEIRKQKRLEDARLKAEAAEKKAAEIEERKRQAAEKALQQKEAAAKEAAAKAERAKKAEESLSTAKPRSTFSLGDLFSFGGDSESAAEDFEAPTSKAAANAPRGVPTISSWGQNRDGSIVGIISGAKGFRDGASVTTSPVPKGASAQTIVTTSSGSRYYLAPKTTRAAPAPAGPSAAQQQAEERRRAAEEKKQEMEAKRAAALAEKQAAAEQRKQEAEARKAAAAAAAEQRKLDAQRKREEAKAIADQKKADAQRKREEAAALAQQKKLEAQQKREAAAAAAAEKRRLAAEAKKAAAAPAKAAPARAVAKQAPRGVPTIRSWKKKSDGGITGKIFGSPSFEDGDSVETSKISRGKIENNSVVQTSSGSRYFLSPEAAKGASGGRGSPFFSFGKKAAPKEKKQAPAPAKSAPKQPAAEKPKPRSTFSLFGFDGGKTAPTKPKPTPAPKKSPPAPRPTFSFQKPAASKQTSKPAAAPRGVPTLKRWRKNRDGSITGLISGSPSFDDGERITTSPIAKGNVANNEVVTTGSGSRYFLG